MEVKRLHMEREILKRRRPSSPGNRHEIFILPDRQHRKQNSSDLYH